MGVSYYDGNQPHSDTNATDASTAKTTTTTSSVRGNSNKENFDNKKRSQDIIVIASDPVSVFIRDMILSQERIQCRNSSPDNGSSNTGGEKQCLREIIDKLKMLVRSQ